MSFHDQFTRAIYMSKNNVFTDLPKTLPNEVLTDLLTGEHIRIERILSQGHCSAENDWYDQEENEWVILVQGDAVLEYEDGTHIKMTAGDYQNIPAHVKHRVLWTHPDKVSIWLAIFY